ncbi:family 43 glycosylhydrolase [Nocardiopsis sp. NPDC006198]|uniref:family 43 glycosylhydrolase n=1 Tax=Nocardiopsis sp. NPDC006198 TaxID=3154472 RepID=UPI0033BB2FFD
MPSEPVTVLNPVLPGSHPDPCVLRVGGDFYLATSTFEWYPGVRLHHSTDLARWRPLGGALPGPPWLDLAGRPDSGGVWAPDLSHADGLFHLVYSNVTSYAGGFTDSPNLLVTAPTIHGPWSDPVPLHARGFDAALLHDGDESWLVSLAHDWRPGHGGSSGLEAVRYDRRARTLAGPPVRIALPEGEHWVEGPRIRRIGSWYYLLTADGGTGYGHRVTAARSRNLAGPYERDPEGPLITAHDRPDLPLQKAGHGCLVDTPAGETYLAYLVARPLGRRGPCVLGRETALAPVTWTAQGWPRVPGGRPETRIPAPAVPRAAGEAGGGDPVPDVHGEGTDHFDGTVLGPHWSTLRRPATRDWVTTAARRSHLRVRGGRSPQSLVGTSLVARRMSSPHCSFETTMEYRPADTRHLAGLTAYYNTRNWFFAYRSADDAGRQVLGVAACDRGRVTLEGTEVLAPGTGGRTRLGVDVDGPRLRFRRDIGGGWNPLGPWLDATVLSDEHAQEIEDGGLRTMGFTGAFVGLWVWDLGGQGLHADFDEATYRLRPPARPDGGR